MGKKKKNRASMSSQAAGALPSAGNAANMANNKNQADLALSGGGAVPQSGQTRRLSQEQSRGAASVPAVLSPSASGKASDGASGGKLTAKQVRKNQKDAQKKNNIQQKCFTGDTLVYTNQGLRPIKDIRKDDAVYAMDVQTGETGLRNVTEVFKKQVHTVYHVWLDGKEELCTTAYHPVSVEEKGWVNVINLQEGDLLKTMDGTALITKIVKERHEHPVTVYNFYVAEWESYFVTGRLVYVHNGKGYVTAAPNKVKALQTGKNKTTVTVKSFSEAEILRETAFPDYQKVAGIGPQDAGWKRKQNKIQSSKMGGTYHKDFVIDKKTKRVRGHPIDDVDGDYPHINIKRRDGKEVVIKIVKEGGT